MRLRDCKQADLVRVEGEVFRVAWFHPAQAVLLPEKNLKDRRHFELDMPAEVIL